jgi:hypothetical protein
MAACKLSRAKSSRILQYKSAANEAAAAKLKLHPSYTIGTGFTYADKGIIPFTSFIGNQNRISNINENLRSH